MIRAELLKLKRSSLWVIAFMLPLLAVITGSVNFAGNQEVLTHGFDSLTSQVSLFYALLFFSIGIACLASAAWRMEHKGTNWNLVLTSIDNPLQIVLAKITVITLGVLAMQVVFIVLTYLSGTLILGADGNLSPTFALVLLSAVITALPLVALQSLLSMVMRSFGAPVALCLIGCVLGFAVLASKGDSVLTYLIPQAMNIRALSIDSVALGSADAFSLATVTPLYGAAFAMTAVVIALSVLVIRYVKLK